MVPSSSRSTIIASAFNVEPLASATETTRPRTTREKYSAAPNSSATDAIGGANSAARRTPR